MKRRDDCAINTGCGEQSPIQKFLGHIVLPFPEYDAEHGESYHPFGVWRYLHHHLDSIHPFGVGRTIHNRLIPFHPFGVEENMNNRLLLFHNFEVWETRIAIHFHLTLLGLGAVHFR